MNLFSLLISTKPVTFGNCEYYDIDLVVCMREIFYHLCETGFEFIILSDPSMIDSSSDPIVPILGSRLPTDILEVRPQFVFFSRSVDLQISSLLFDLGLPVRFGSRLLNVHAYYTRTYSYRRQVVSSERERRQFEFGLLHLSLINFEIELLNNNQNIPIPS